MPCSAKDPTGDSRSFTVGTFPLVFGGVIALISWGGSGRCLVISKKDHICWKIVVGFSEVEPSAKQDVFEMYNEIGNLFGLRGDAKVSVMKSVLEGS